MPVTSGANIGPKHMTHETAASLVAHTGRYGPGHENNIAEALRGLGVDADLADLGNGYWGVTVVGEGDNDDLVITGRQEDRRLKVNGHTAIGFYRNGVQRMDRGIEMRSSDVADIAEVVSKVHNPTMTLVDQPDTVPDKVWADARSGCDRWHEEPGRGLLFQERPVKPEHRGEIAARYAEVQDYLNNANNGGKLTNEEAAAIGRRQMEPYTQYASHFDPAGTSVTKATRRIKGRFGVLAEPGDTLLVLKEGQHGATSTTFYSFRMPGFHGTANEHLEGS